MQHFEIKNIKSLKAILIKDRKLGTRPKSKMVYSYNIFAFRYDLLGIDMLGEGFYIKRTHNENWEVFYLERNTKFSLVVFESEQAACEYFYNWVSKFKNSF